MAKKKIELQTTYQLTITGAELAYLRCWVDMLKEYYDEEGAVKSSLAYPQLRKKDQVEVQGIIEDNAGSLYTKLVNALGQ